MSRRIFTVTLFFVFNVFFFAVYLSCIHQNKTDLVTQPGVSPFNAAFSEPLGAEKPPKNGPVHSSVKKDLPIPVVNNQ